MAGMSPQQISRLINRYIGVEGGYLGDFSYATHRSFYPEFCDLDINPDEIQGTTRIRFQTILTQASPENQARIIRGIMVKYPPHSDDKPARTPEIHAEFLALADGLAGLPVTNPTPAITSEIVILALTNAQTLLENDGATSGVDRVHTALHGYLRAVCRNEKIAFADDAHIGTLMKLLREQHPAFRDKGTRDQDIETILRSLSAIMASLNPIRNNASAAHPNDDLLGPHEAMLVINVTRTILHYVDGKLSRK